MTTNTTSADKMSEEVKYDRRRFLSTAVMSIAAAQPSKTKPPVLPTIKPGTNTSFNSLKQIDGGVLNVGYAEAGPAAGPAVILLHGWRLRHSYAKKFSGKYTHRLIKGGIGHNLPQEAPQAFAKAVLDVDRY